MQRIVGTYSESKLGKIGSTDRDRSCSPEAFNERSIGRRYKVSKNWKTLSGGCACYIYVFFDCARDTM
jgi:hypothetical protein